jgi:hypothetical protein
MPEVKEKWLSVSFTSWTGNDTPETNTWLNLQKIGCAVTWNYFWLLMLKVVPDISRHYFDALNEREIGR